MSSVLVRKEGGAAWLTLSRPEAGNAVNPAMAYELAEAARDVAADPAIRCVVLTGAGRLFCVGGDVPAMAAAGQEAGPFLRDLADTLHGAIVTLTDMVKPLVVLVNGPAAGAGLSLGIMGDVVLAVRSAHFTAAYTGVGLSPDGGMSWLLPRLVGLRRAQAVILTNQRIGAEEAERIGMVTRTVDDADLIPEAQAVVARLIASPTAALGAARRLLIDGATATLPDHLDREAQTIARAGAHAEAREGIAAFMERRKSDFQGT
ncbi:2-(1,2-epoxy-1,2-dihydrophenyl)acetyl-CoA isomerase [Sphingomonas sp. SORGH_AS870]|uniref:enoyl-CoA hydratase/isomerase family protein n=1 Tax=Sphingomonas sp. SORGH_AS_0870 TaxID=3041801 RepID=UPI002855B31F|nr:enoyl-CoA hydratase-related protein [Sphingomonas sp. SORGH_AS_0870]MDR6146520.1 2-(1,2-epoxy-1,2-dihydrophenyl)acetyl-CoA isomerase [Sphingomonas sp. SORGH_AS_0870]